MTRTFTFQAGAKPVLSQNRFRDEFDGENVACHISVDPRLVRGSNYARHKTKSDNVEPIRYKPKPIPKFVERSEKLHNEEEEAEDLLNKEPEWVEIKERPVEDDIATATETFIERPPTPLFVEEEKGVDIETQVGANDLFDFDKEVRPIMKVIVQHTLLRALAEVHEEVEIENISKHRDRFEVERNTVLAELQRLEAKTQRSYDEVKRRNAQRKEFKDEVKKLNQKIARHGFSEYYATDMILNAMDVLEEKGVFYDEVEKEVSQVFLPWLSTELTSAISCKQDMETLQSKTKEFSVNIAKKAQTETKEIKTEAKKAQNDREMHALRVMLMEDRAGESIRRALDAYEKKKQAQNAQKKKDNKNDDGNNDSDDE